MVTVPDVVGMAQASAEAAITAAILTVGNVTTDYSATVPAGDVISQSPTAGASVVHDSAVDIVVSLGEEPVGDFVAPNPDPMTWAAVPAAGTGTDQVVLSEGFESPDQGDTGYTYTPTGTAWTWSANAGLSGPNGPWYCDSTSPDPLGNQFAYLQHDASIVQTVTGLTVGETYEVSFFEAYRTWFGTSGNDLSVIIDEGQGSEVVIYNNPNVSNNTWQARTTSQFVAPASSVTLTFRTTNPQSLADCTTIIDGMELVSIGLPVTSISMTATTATDASGVEYYFTCTVGGGNDSGWQDSESYTDSGLSELTTYTYTVIARDKSVNQNATAPSTAESATTGSTTPPADTVTITKAEYKASKSELKVEATSSDQPNVTLTVVGYGTMTWKSPIYEYKEKPVSNPGATVTVTSSGGGQDTANVTQK
jgi:hypothetical protein